MRRSRLLGLIFLMPLLFPLSSSTASHGRDADRGAKIAVLLDLSGGQATLGQPAMNGFVLALQKASARQNPYVFAALLDTRTDPTTTLVAARTVVSSAVVAAGFTDNDAVLLAGRIFQKKRVPFLSIGATDPALPAVIGDRIFLTPFGDNAQAAAGAEFARTAFGSTVAIMFDDTLQYSRTLPRYFRTRFEQLGGTVLLDIPYHGGCDVSAIGAQVVHLTPVPSFIYLAGIPDCIGEVVASLRTAGVNQPILGGDGLDTPNLQVGGEEPPDAVWYTTHAWLSAETGTPQTKQFIEAYEQAYGTPPEDAFAALGYDAANLLLDVLQRAEKMRPRDITEALGNTQAFQGVTGTISYTAKNHVPRKTVWIIQVSKGQPSLAAAFIPQVIPAPIIETGRP
jgi:branched-chain amino acid transport system substrate-binding protein